MKRGANAILRPKGLKYFFLCICIGFVSLATAQEDAEQVQDSVKTGVALGQLRLDNPKSIVSRYTYNPELDRYIYTESIGDFDISYPIILTPEQYFELIRKEGMKSYFKEKIDAVTGKKEGSQEARKNLLPNFYVNSGFFESIFGGNRFRGDGFRCFVAKK